MAGTTTDSDTSSRCRGIAAAVVAVVLASTGCTICPDPFDYSGPVPDGSSPQNDFRARSGGILPVGAAAKPWPPIVKDAGRPAAMPVIAEGESVDPAAPVAVEGDATQLRQTSVLVPDQGGGEDGAVASEQDAGPTVVPPAGLPSARFEAPGSATPACEAGTDRSAKPGGTTTDAPREPPAVAPTPRPEPRESPGWRPRRRWAG